MIRFNTPYAEHVRIAKAQSKFTLELAEKVEVGAELTKLERKWISAMLRRAAEEIPEEPKGVQGQEKGTDPKLDPGNLAIEYAILVNLQGCKKYPAYDKLAEKYGVDPKSVQKALKKYAAEALKLIPQIEP